MENSSENYPVCTFVDQKFKMEPFCYLHVVSQIKLWFSDIKQMYSLNLKQY